MKKSRTYSRYAIEAAILLGQSIKLARKTRGFTTQDFADRVGISRITLQKIEKGDLKCELGLVLEAAALAGVTLFGVEATTNTFGSIFEKVSDKIALLPKSIRKKTIEVDDDF